MKRIKQAKKKVQIKRAIEYILAFVIPFGIFCAIHFPLYPNIVLTKIYTAIGIFAILAAIFLFVLYLWSELDSKYSGEKEDKE